MSTFDRRWTDEQKEAVYSAFRERGIRPLARVLILARTGELVHMGKRLDPFAMPETTARGEIQAEDKRRAGRAHKTADLNPDDAIETLRRRLIAAAEAGIDRFEKQANRGDPNFELGRQIARCLREIKAIPPKTERGVKPGDKIPASGGKHNSGATRGGLAGSILASARREANEETVPERPSPPATQAENGTAEAQQNRHANIEPDPSPGSAERSAGTSRSTLLSPRVPPHG